MNNQNNPHTVADLFNAMLAAMQRIEQKVDFIIESIEMTGECDDADISPFGRERDSNETL